MNTHTQITFIGGPMDMTRLSVPGAAPPYYRFATPPPVGALFSKPERPGYLPAAPTVDYQIVHLHDARGRDVWVGLPLEIA